MTPENPSSITDATGASSSASPRAWPEWVGKFLARNPFYLVSAALLLFGINRLSIDPTFLGAEEPKLAFNFAALQLYEILLVFVAVVLATRKVWYDSTLLVVLENGLLLVPFILLTQAILNHQGLAIALAVTGTLMTVARYGVLHRWLPSLQLSRPLLRCGALLLALNLALPILFRQLMEKSVENWEIPGLVGWLLVLPLLAALANLLPRPVEYSDLPPRKSWLPMLLLALWVGGSAVHLWSIGYVAERAFHSVYLLPLIWVAAWTVYNRLTDFHATPSPELRQLCLYFPMIIPFLGIGQWNGHVSFALLAANVAAYGALAWVGKEKTLAFQLLCVSSAGLLAALPLDWGQMLTPDFARSKAICLALGAYVMLQALLSRHPAIGLCGALVAGMAPGFLFGKPLWNEGLQMGCTFLLLHSLWWRDQDVKQTSLLRFVTAVTWSVHALAWTHSDETFSRVTVSSSAVALLAGYFLFRLLRGYYPPATLFVAACVCLCATPLHLGMRVIKASPTGLLSVLGSFVLFGAGTIFAMNKHRWQAALARARKPRR